MIKYENNFKYTELTGKIIEQAYKVHNILGYGFLEKVYENAFIGQFCADLMVDDKVIVELKAVEIIIPAFEVQLVNYLKATGIEVGLLINFGPKHEFKRRVFSVNHNIHNKSTSKD